VLSGRGLCDKLITRPEESYRLCCVVVCDLETSRIGAPYIYDISNLRVNITLPSTPGLPGGLFPSGLATKTLCKGGKKVIDIWLAFRIFVLELSGR